MDEASAALHEQLVREHDLVTVDEEHGDFVDHALELGVDDFLLLLVLLLVVINVGAASVVIAKLHGVVHGEELLRALNKQKCTLLRTRTLFLDAREVDVGDAIEVACKREACQGGIFVVLFVEEALSYHVDEGAHLLEVRARCNDQSCAFAPALQVVVLSLFCNLLLDEALEHVLDEGVSRRHEE